MRFRLITPDQLDEALREQRETGRDVGAIVVERGWINEDQLARLLSYAPAFPGASEPASAPTEPEVEQQPEVEHQPEAELPEHAAEAEVDPEPESQPEPEPEPDAPWVGSDVSPSVDASPALELPSAADVPPALELPEPEPSSTAERETEEAPVGVAEVNEVAESTPTVEHGVALMPLQPVVSPEPVVAPEPVVEAEPVVVVAAEPVVEAGPAVGAEPVVAEPSPEAEAAPEPVAAAEPVAEAAVTVEPAPVAEVAPEPAVVATEPQTVKFVEPAAIETIARVFVRLSNGERVEAGSFDDIAAAKARADEVVSQVSNGNEGWPFFAGRYIRPEAIVSVDLDTTVVRYA